MPTLSFTGLFSNCTSTNGCNTSCLQTAATDFENAAAKGLVLVSDLLNWINNTTSFLIPYLTAVAATATDPNVKAAIQEVITILTVAQNIDVTAEAAVVALEGFQLPTTISAAGHDISELQTAATSFGTVITTLNANGVNTGISATALGKVNSVLTQIATGQQAVASVAAAATAAVPAPAPATPAPVATAPAPVVAAPVVAPATPTAAAAPTTTPAATAAAAAQPTLTALAATSTAAPATPAANATPAEAPAAVSAPTLAVA